MTTVRLTDKQMDELVTVWPRTADRRRARKFIADVERIVSVELPYAVEGNLHTAAELAAMCGRLERLADLALQTQVALLSLPNRERARLNAHRPRMGIDDDLLVKLLHDVWDGAQITIAAFKPGMRRPARNDARLLVCTLADAYLERFGSKPSATREGTFPAFLDALFPFVGIKPVGHDLLKRWLTDWRKARRSPDG